MALPNAAMPAYYSPASASRNHSRRSSGRRSFAAIPSVAGVESPRTLCPRDGDAFSYSPQHLKEWFISQDLWNNLSATVQSTVAALQHSGAAVLTGFERLEKHSEASLVADIAAMEAEAAENWNNLPAQIQSTMARLRSLQHEIADGMEVLGSPKISMARTMSDAGSLMSDPPTTSGLPYVSESQATCPISPMCLNPETPAEERHHERRVTFPLEPHKAYYVTELTTLRTEALPRLRHASRKVDTEWYECKRLGAVKSDDIVEFEQWYLGKKAIIRELDDKCKALCAASDISPTGMGWTCPIKKDSM
ncbi:hypothetical protein BCR34DRAFT_478260 [Clohesyomyces aquaticus]|uniref:Uncharacterized protein n=1 Tax=Clohesyomyces aquaticus TaxID=1231657 RepID=A0A1Y1ZYS4_9PLEO|nr:hypothetical protein BCR34DRAFT_478260 [Clohesyomyces aquaticus]